MHGLVGPTSNWIAVVAAMIGFVQVIVSVRQNNQAINAAQQGEAALKEVREERSRVEEIKGRILQLEKLTQERSHETAEALLKIQGIEARVQELTAGKQREIAEKTGAVERSRLAYAEAQERLQKVSPTVEVEVARTITDKECKQFGLFGKVCIPSTKTVLEKQKRANPEYAALQQAADQASLTLKEAEVALSKALGQ